MTFIVSSSGRPAADALAASAAAWYAEHTTMVPDPARESRNMPTSRRDFTLGALLAAGTLGLPV